MSDKPKNSWIYSSNWTSWILLSRLIRCCTFSLLQYTMLFLFEWPVNVCGHWKQSFFRHSLAEKRYIQKSLCSLHCICLSDCIMQYNLICMSCYFIMYVVLIFQYQCAFFVCVGHFIMCLYCVTQYVCVVYQESICFIICILMRSQCGWNWSAFYTINMSDWIKAFT